MMLRKFNWLALCLVLISPAVQAQTASLLPNGKQTFVDLNGQPYSSGSVYFYIPSTTTPKTTWSDNSQGTPNSNPVVLDSAGRAVIFGAGQYREVLKDQFGNTIWDQVVAGTVSSLTAGAGITLSPSPITASGTISVTPGQIPGTTTNDSATAGNVGEYISNTNSGQAITSTVVLNATSIPLTAGDWDVSANCVWGVGTATISFAGCTISTTNSGILTPIGSYIEVQGITSNSSNMAHTVGPVRVSLASPATYYLNLFANFTGTVSGGGLLSARRVR